MIKGLSAKEFDIIINILKNYSDKFNFSFFGSRASGINRKFSDLDICFRQKDSASIQDLLKLEEEIENSDFPYNVDLVDFKKCDSDFQQIIKGTEIEITFDINR